MSSNDNMPAEPGSAEERVNVLEAERSVLQNALDVADLGVWSWDLDDTVTCDDRASRLIGLPEAGAVTVADFLVPFKEASHVRLLDTFDAARRQNEAFDERFELEARASGKGEQLRLQGQLTADARTLSGTCSLTEMSGDSRGALDLFEVQAQQEQLASALEQAQESNAELQSFASVASHDLREPLRMISSYLRLLQERSPDALDARAQRYINYACEGADRMRSLIEDLLSYSRLDSSAQCFEPVALDEVLEGAIGNLAVAIKHAAAEVTVDINNSPVVFGDRSRLVRLFQNMLGNAIKFHSEGSTPRVSVGFTDGNFVGEPDCWVVTIQDNGIGIDPDHQDLLFNVFQRLNTRDEFEGSGIGLAVCKKIAEQHEGRIWFASELGKGSTFYVTLAKLQEAAIRD